MRPRKAKKSESGQSLVEFALIVPILIILLFGIIEFGWLFNGQITVTSAAREGARTAAVAVIDGSGELSTADRDSIEKSIENHIQGLSGLTLTTFDVKYNGDYDELSEITNDPGAGNACAYVVFVPGSGGYTEVRVFVKGKMSWLTGLFSLVSDSVQLGAKSVMRKE